MIKNLKNIHLERILKHFIFWFIFFTVLFLLSGTQHLNNNFWEVDLPLILVYIYISVYLIIPFFIEKRSYSFLVLSIILFTLVLSYFRLRNYDFIYYSIFAPELQKNGTEVKFSQLLLNAKDFSFALFVFMAFKYTRSWLKYEKDKVEIVNNQLQSEIRLMKTQIDPHFLFNTLNNIYSLSVTYPPNTRNAVKKLWGLLDFLINDTDHEEVLIEKELKLISDYIELEKLRYGERLIFEFHVDDKLKDYRIPPLIMYPFIENCFKHGSSLDPGNPWIRIRIIEMDDRIRFTARNSRKDENDDMRQEMEISNSIEGVRKRLEYFLPGRHKLKISIKADEYSVQLDIIT